ncbi:MAG TPA: enoyl-CoA hydratase/isomerase family protein [Smithellaceae bacterium]|nr:enoyl-CoA hydratase/isomerase family protein [Smithellaceae bacterium]
MEYKNMTFETNDGVAVVTLNRPDSNNTLSVDLMQELEAMADALQTDLETKAVVFTGAGKNFSMGADVADPKQHELQSGPVLKKLRGFSLGPRMITKLNSIPQITIAAVNGFSLGGGTCIASALDFRIGAENCKCGLPENNLGMNLSWLALPLIVNLIGPSRAKQFVILSKNETAQTLHNWGWLNEVVPQDQLMERAMELAREYAAKAPLTTQMIKRSINTLAQALDSDIMHMDSEQYILASMTEDYKEGLTALMERRKPAFKGR